MCASFRRSARSHHGPDERPVSLLERFELVNSNLGHPHIVTFIVRLAHSGEHGVNLESLRERALVLQDRFPMLWAEVGDRLTPRPKFRARAEGKWKAEELVRSERIPDCGITSDPNEEMLLQRELDGMTEARRHPTGPPWRVTLLESDSDTQVGPTGVRFMTLSTDHTHFDGTGSLRLLMLLLDHPERFVRQSTREEVFSDLSIYEETVDVRPSLRRLVPIAYQELVLPFFPKCLRKILGQNQPPWPGVHIAKPLLEASPGMMTGHISPQILAKLKARNKLYGSATLHPVLNTIFTIAVWSMVHCQSASGTSSTLTDSAFAITSGTAISERDPIGKGHAVCTGVYISDLEYTVILNPLKSFWGAVRQYGTLLASERGRRLARGTVGLLRHLPSGMASRKATGGGAMTGWEAYFDDKVQSTTPVRVALAVSNLGNVISVAQPFESTPGEGAVLGLPSDLVESLVWTQSATPYVAPIMVNVAGWAGGLSWTISFRDGSVVSRYEVEQINSTAQDMAAFLAEAAEAELNDLSIGALARNVRAEKSIPTHAHS